MQLISDIHLEFRSNFEIIPKAKYLALAFGDIGKPHDQNYKKLISTVSKQFEKVFIISGNHEYYSNDRYTMDEIDQQITKIVNQYPNVYFLNNNEHVMDNVVILGTTLWSDVSSEAVYIKQTMNDYRCIYVKDPHLTFITPNHVVNLFNKNVKWLEDKNNATLSR